MRNLILFLHLGGAIFWMGGMAFMLVALRPALAAHLQPPVRLPLMVLVLRRFFAIVTASIAALLVTGVWLLMQAPLGGRAPIGWHVMAGIGIVMMLVFGHIFFSPWRRLQRATAMQEWAEGGKRMNQIARLVTVNFTLGWIAIAAVILWG